MIELIMAKLTDMKDYTAVLSLFTKDGPIQSETVETLIPIYEEYFTTDYGKDFPRIGLAADMLLTNTKDDLAAFAPLGFSNDTLEAIFLVKDLTTDITIRMTPEEVSNVVIITENDTIPLPVRIMVARAALDVLISRRNYSEHQNEVGTLAKFLIGCDVKLIDTYTMLMGEIRWKCRKIETN